MAYNGPNGKVQRKIASCPKVFVKTGKGRRRKKEETSRGVKEERRKQEGERRREEEARSKKQEARNKKR